MARKPTVLPHAVETEIQTRIARGESAQTIHDTVPGAPSLSTIKRLQSKLRNTRTPQSSRRKADAAGSTDVPEVIPEGSPLDVYNTLHDTVERAIRQAERDENLSAVASLVAKQTAIAEARRKATPIPKADPSDNPDIRALGEQVEKRFLALIDGLFAE